MAVRSSKQRTEAERIICCNTVEVQFSPAKEPAELQSELRELAREIVSNLSALDSAQGKALLDSFVSELFASIAKQEQREARRQKHARGIAEAKARGVRFGPRPRDLPEGFEEMRQAWRSKKISLKVAAELCGIPRTTFYDAAIRAEAAANCVAAE